MLATDIEFPPGFADPVVDSQTVFRAVLTAMANPGTIHEIPITAEAPRPLAWATAAVCLALFDTETPVWLQAPTPSLVAYLTFHCGCSIVNDARDARFAVVTDVRTLPTLDRFDAGTIDYPDRSATLIVQVDDLIANDGPTFTGPGIREHVRLDAHGLSPGFWHERRNNVGKFPCGVDLIVTAHARVAGLPRTTHVEA